MATDVFRQILRPEIVSRKRLSWYVRSACGVEARIRKHVRGMLKLSNGLCMLKINDRRGRVDGKAPQFVTRNEGVRDGIKPMIGDSHLPFKRIMKMPLLQSQREDLRRNTQSAQWHNCICLLLNNMHLAHGGA